MAFGSYVGKWTHRGAGTEANGSREQTLVLPQSLLSHGAEDGMSSTTPIAVPDYSGASESTEPAAAPSISMSLNKPRSKHAAVRLAKQHDSDEEGE